MTSKEDLDKKGQVWKDLMQNPMGSCEDLDRAMIGSVEQKGFHVKY